MRCRVWLQGDTLIWMDLGEGRVREVGALGVTKKQNGSIPTPSLFPYLPRCLDLSTSCNPLREKKRRLKPDIAVFRYYKGGHVEEGADFLCVSPEGQS